jgi:hypothetical protein
MRSFDEFHDGQLDGILIQGSILSLFVSTHNKQEFVLRAKGVQSLKVDGFRQGNIIFDVLLRSAEDVTVDDIMSHYQFNDEAKAKIKFEEMSRRNLCVLEINPSYGATCTVLAESIELLRGAYSKGDSIDALQ